MAIQVTCVACQKNLNVKVEYAGRTGKCPACGEALKIPPLPDHPASEGITDDSFDWNMDLPELPKRKKDNLRLQSLEQKSITAATDPKQLMQEILDSFGGHFLRVVPSLGYRFAALIVAVVMVLLPIVYVGLIGGCVGLLYWHATAHVGILSGARGFALGKFVALIYFGPLFAGGVLILFMVKPLFARPGSRMDEVELSFEDEPLLHRFVQRLCEEVGAPQPTLIEVDCEANAAAFYRGGWRGFWRRDLGLRIGLPLFLTLNTRELAGILAHELGHFSQGAGMRLGLIIRTVNVWFARVIYERDSWDEWLESFVDDDSWWWVRTLIFLAYCCVILTRGVLWLLMMFGHAVSCSLSRQMEYDADQYEVRLAGSDVFESSMRHLVELSLAQAFSYRVLGANYDRLGLPDNMPKFLTRLASKLPSELEKLANEIIEHSRTDRFSSHPAERERIAAAHRQHAPGIFRLERPAKVLLRKFSKHAEEATYLNYARRIGKKAAQAHMIPTKEYLTKIGPT